MIRKYEERFAKIVEPAEDGANDDNPKHIGQGAKAAVARSISRRPADKPRTVERRHGTGAKVKLKLPKQVAEEAALPVTEPLPAKGNAQVNGLAEMLQVLSRIADALEAQKPVLTAEQAAKLLKCAPDTLSRFNRIELPALPGPGRSRVYLQEDIIGHFQRLRNDARRQ